MARTLYIQTLLIPEAYLQEAMHRNAQEMPQNLSDFVCAFINYEWYQK